jgi:hypothetical protein
MTPHYDNDMDSARYESRLAGLETLAFAHVPPLLLCRAAQVGGCSAHVHRTVG